MTASHVARKLLARLGRDLTLAYIEARLHELDPTDVTLDRRRGFWAYAYSMASAAEPGFIARLRLDVTTRHAAHIFRRDYQFGVKGVFDACVYQCPFCKRMEEWDEIEAHAERCTALRTRAVLQLAMFTAEMRQQVGTAAVPA